MKGALTGNAAQVLWNTDRASTGSLKKLISILKGRFSGERLAEKYRAELQIRRRRSNEILTELHQDIRRLMVLAYPRLTAEAREEIACDHFTNAFSDPDFALKVKERAPKTSDEALNIALRLEAWLRVLVVLGTMMIILIAQDKKLEPLLRQSRRKRLPTQRMTKWSIWKQK